MPREIFQNLASVEIGFSYSSTYRGYGGDKLSKKSNPSPGASSMNALLLRTIVLVHFFQPVGSRPERIGRLSLDSVRIW